MSKIGTEEMIESLGRHWNPYPESIVDGIRVISVGGEGARDAIVARLRAADELAKANTFQEWYEALRKYRES